MPPASRTRSPGGSSHAGVCWREKREAFVAKRGNKYNTFSIKEFETKAVAETKACEWADEDDSQEVAAMGADDAGDESQETV